MFEVYTFETSVVYVGILIFCLFYACGNKFEGVVLKNFGYKVFFCFLMVFLSCSWWQFFVWFVIYFLPSFHTCCFLFRLIT